MYNIFELNEKSLDDLKIIATEMGIDDENRDRTQLIYDIIKKKQKTKNDKPEPKPEPVAETPKEPKKPKEEPVKEPVAPVAEAAEPVNNGEAQPKRNKRPRIVKGAESNEQPKTTPAPVAETPVATEPRPEKVEEPAPITTPETADNEEFVEPKPNFEKRENFKQKRKHTQENNNIVETAPKEEDIASGKTGKKDLKSKKRSVLSSVSAATNSSSSSTVPYMLRAYWKSCPRVSVTCARPITTTCLRPTTSTFRNRKSS